MPGLDLLLEEAEKIKSPIGLGVIAIGVIGVIFLNIDEPQISVISAAIISLIFIVACFASKIGTPPKEDVNTAENISHDLRVREGIWEKLDTLLQDLGFSTRKRDDSEELIPTESKYKFSLAKGSVALFIVQLEAKALTPAAVFQLGGMRQRLKKMRGYDIMKLVIICDTEQIYNGLYYSRGTDRALLLNHSINKIRGERNAAITHLKEQLLL